MKQGVTFPETLPDLPFHCGAAPGVLLACLLQVLRLPPAPHGVVGVIFKSPNGALLSFPIQLSSFVELL